MSQTRPGIYSDKANLHQFPTNLSLQFIGKAGQVSLWVFFIIFFCATIGVGLIVGRVEKRARVFHA